MAGIIDQQSKIRRRADLMVRRSKYLQKSIKASTNKLQIKSQLITCLSVICFTGLLANPVAAKSPAIYRNPSSLDARLNPETRKQWLAHLAGQAKIPLQPACHSYALSPPADQPKRGNIILLHGFTACPQQFEDLAPLLAAAGFQVFVPLLPGHGRPPRQTAEGWQDDLSEMPDEAHYQRYHEFAQEMGEWLQAEPGLNVISGLSLGGSVAASAFAKAPAVFDRALILTPFMDVPFPQNLALFPANALLPNFIRSWGASCENERANGRNGYCQYTISQARASQHFGQDNQNTLRLDYRPVQWVGVAADPAISNMALIRTAQQLAHTSLCFYPKRANHSLVSPYDGLEQEKFWLKALTRDSLAFIQSGTAFRIQGESEEAGFRACSLD